MWLEMIKHRLSTTEDEKTYHIFNSVDPDARPWHAGTDHHDLTVKTLKGDPIHTSRAKNMDSLRVLDGLGIKVLSSGSTVSVRLPLLSGDLLDRRGTTPPGDANINRNIVANDQGKNLNFFLLELPRVSVAAHTFSSRSRHPTMALRTA
jgi:hypothetical protein